jgi:hypothetical protein
MPPPERNLGPPPRQAEGPPAENGTPTDHSDFNRNFIRTTSVNGYTGLWPVHFALRWAPTAPVIPLEHGTNIPHRLILGSG